MEILKMIADWHSENTPENYRTWEDIPNEEKDWNSWWYLHGKLENFVGYDKATVTNCKSGGFARETVAWSEIVGDKVIAVYDKKPSTELYLNGIVNVEIEGIDKPCKGYFWTTDERDVYWQGKSYKHWKQRGLVCFADDEKACQYAESAMSARDTML